jgi:hypothetical protein
MARFVFDSNRLNSTVEQKGKEYSLRLMQRAQTIFTTLINLLPSSYVSAVQGPNYTQALKAVAVELARIELALEDIDRDRQFSTTRSDFLYSIVGYLVLVNSKLPNLGFSDEEFRNFFLNLIRIYFQGSIPESMKDVVELFMSGDIRVTEQFLLFRAGASGLDISDEFGFTIDVIAPPGGGFPPDIFDADSAIRQILDLVRPAHTLFRIRYIFTDKYIPNDTIGKILDAMRWRMGIYYYDDFRSYWQGIRDRDRLGRKVNQCVVNESHSASFLVVEDNVPVVEDGIPVIEGP